VNFENRVYCVCGECCSLSGGRFVMQGEMVFVKGLVIKGFEMRDKVRTYLKQVSTRWTHVQRLFNLFIVTLIRVIIN